MPTLHHDIFNTKLPPNADGLDFDASNETWTNPGFTIFSEFGDGVSNHGHTNSTLKNYGKIISQEVSGSNAGVVFNLGNDSILNGAGALIEGKLIAVIMNGNGNDVLSNYGTIKGDLNTGVYFFPNAGNETINNYGSISAPSFAVFDQSASGGGTFNNHGSITSAFTAIDIRTATSLHSTITNFAGATIAGGTWAVLGESGSFKLVNHGKIVGAVYDADHANDTFINTGIITGIVHLGKGNDKFNGVGGIAHNIFAEGGSDVIKVGKGHVFVSLGSGSNTVTAGTGHDIFFFSDPLTSQIETFKGFNPHLDSFELSSGNFPGLALGHLTSAEFHLGAPVGTNSQIVYTPGNGDLYLYPFGTSGGANHFATINPHGEHLTLNSFLVVS